MLVDMSDLFAGYAEALQRSDAWDEMFAPEFTLRTDYRPVERVLEERQQLIDELQRPVPAAAAGPAPTP